MSDAKRAFIALCVSDDLKKDLSAAVKDLKIQYPFNHIRWIPSSNWHLTLAFLGDQSLNKLNVLWEELAPLIESYGGFTLSAECISRFPDAKSSIIAVLLNKDPKLLSLQKDIAKVCDSHDMPLDKRAFKPHITLGRIRKGQRVAFADQPLSVLDTGSQVALYTSELTPEGSIYTQFKIAALS